MRIVIKVGSHVLNEDGQLAMQRIASLCDFLADLMQKHEVILVSSGAVAAGHTKLKLDRSIVGNKQAIAAVGQPYLVSVYQDIFKQRDITVAQILLGADDFDSRRHTKHAKIAVDTLLDNGVLPIINENDVTSIEELVFGDNDQLSAHSTHHFNADLLVILSDIDGYYDDDPHTNPEAKMLSIVHSVSQEELAMEHTPNNEFATGGIVTKLKSAAFLLSHDREMFLATGFDLSDIRSYLLEGKHIGGTHFKKALS
ncbi:MAG TPA: glutamate 5-kinase [Sulfurovum sp.]|nr:glutamate 5-kinase [Sulfurovum sp.]